MRTPEKSAREAKNRADRKAREEAQDEADRKAGIGHSRGGASEIRNLKDDPAARADAEETLKRLEGRSPRRGAPPWR